MKDSLVPAVGYARRSTDRQEASIPDQVKQVEQFAASRGYRILRWHIDDGISGDDTEKRAGFLKMITEAQQVGDFRVILCWDQSRFGRFSPQEAGYWTYPLARLGIQLVTTDKGPIDWADFTGWLTYSVDQHAKHQFVVNLSRDVARGQKEAAEAGSWRGSAPYGYRIEGPRKNKRLVLGDPGHVRVVQRIYREFVDEGRSLRSIAARLQNDGYASPGGRGKPWRYDTVRVILENPAYAGDYAAGRYGGGKYHTARDGQVVKGIGRRSEAGSAWKIIPDRHEAIINRHTWEQAQSLLERGKTGRSPYSPEENPYLLAGLLRCGRCGCPMWGEVQGRDPARRTRFYCCGNRDYHDLDDEVCRGTRVREDHILRTIAEHIEQDILSLDGENLYRAAERGELTPDDWPRAFAKVKSLVAPPRQPKADRDRAEKLVKSLTEKIDKARRNLDLPP
jgi:DNA invertase Pin-like site-specific DNA recombinase